MSFKLYNTESRQDTTIVFQSLKNFNACFLETNLISVILNSLVYLN